MRNGCDWGQPTREKKAWSGVLHTRSDGATEFTSCRACCSVCEAKRKCYNTELVNIPNRLATGNSVDVKGNIVDVEANPPIPPSPPRAAHPSGRTCHYCTRTDMLLQCCYNLHAIAKTIRARPDQESMREWNARVIRRLHDLRCLTSQASA
eukprot:1175565-Prorocentrum_minimum.AAC.2